MKKILIALVLFLSSLVSFALNDTASHSILINIPEIAVLDLNNTNVINMDVSAGASGGDDAVGSTDTSKILQYTSLVPAGQTRLITINCDALDTFPSGTQLSVEATSVPLNCGSSNGLVIISSVAKTIVSSIGSCATGTGVNGATLEYSLTITDKNALVANESKTINITFTLTDAS